MSASRTKQMHGDIPTGNDPRWAAVVARDHQADGTFYYSVATTGVYCRPSCGSRRANPKNVRFHRTTADAERAGFRPCQRCKPDQPALERFHAAKVADICRMIEAREETPSLAALAKRAGLSPYHFHRVFKAVTGVTPRAYAAAHRTKRVRNELTKRSKTVTEAIYDAGFNSGGRFYETSDQLLGMTPTNYRAGGADTEIHFAVGECSLGSILVAQSAKGVCAILLGDDPDALVRDLQDRFPRARLVGGDAAFEQTVAKVIGFVEAPALGLDLPSDVRGTAFQQRVWQVLREIPAGSTASYTEIAARIGAPNGARAVAQACGANALAVAIPWPPRSEDRWITFWLPLGGRAQAEPAQTGGSGMGTAIKTRQIGAVNIDTRMDGYDWTSISEHLDAHGWAMFPKLLTAGESAAVAGLYADDRHFRSHIVMARHGFGRGEYKYFTYPLPDKVADLRTALYPRLAPIANRWNESMGIDVRYPDAHADFIKRCHKAGQTRPTPLLLQYAEGDFNALHQDLYGEHAFPLQVAILLSEPGKDFTGGEFVLTEQRPRMQSRAEVVPLRRGDGVIFAVHNRPVQGTRGTYRVNLRHGVSRLRSGHRHTVGVIFHDAK